jgi:bifunctional isochorismate lyase/aryl carrier protein
MSPGLPRIGAYELPAPGEIPTPRAPWQVNPKRAALLIHDMQNYFVGAFGGNAPIGTVVANIRALRDRCDALGIPVFYTALSGDEDRRDRGLQADFWGPGMPARDGQPEIVADLTPAPGNIVLHKWRYSAFQRTTLEPMMRVRGRDQLIVCGIFAHIGVLMTTADAFMRDIEAFMVADGVADFSRQYHDLALTYAAGRCGVPVTTAALLETLR